MYSWELLKQKCPIDIKNIVSKAQEIEHKLIISKNIRKELDYRVNNIMSIKGELEILMMNFFSILNYEFSMEDKTDEWVFKNIKDFLGNTLKRIEMIEQDESIERKKEERIRRMSNQIEPILYGIIYDSIDMASIFKNKKDFIYSLLKNVKTRVEISGVETREIIRKRKFSENIFSSSEDKEHRELFDERIEEAEKKIKTLKRAE